MAISRRHLLRRIGAAAAAATAVPSLAEASLGAVLGGDTTSAAGGVAGGPIRLNRNENARGPSANVIATIREAAHTAAHRYPDVEVEALRNRIASFHGLPPDRVVVGCGSGEILRIAADAFVGPRHSLIVAQPTFELIGAYAQRAGADIVAVPLRKDFSHDLPAMLARSDAATGLVYICNPNNPTGSLTRRRELEGFIRELPETTYVLIDEAYHHYVGESPDYASFIDRPVDDSRVIVARSFSKIYGLAGLRAGYAVAAPETARKLASCRLLESINVVAASAAVAALDDQEYVRLSVTRNVDDRQEFVNQAHARMLKPIDSQTNFVMVNLERPALEIIERFRQYGILLPPPVPSFEKYIRVSLGSPAEMREFWEVWDLMPVRHASM
jgi:histidinol-phosphate aminotransferase